MEIILQPGQWIDIDIKAAHLVEFQKTSFGQQCFLLPEDVEIQGSVVCPTASRLRAINASFENMTIVI